MDDNMLLRLVPLVWGPGRDLILRDRCLKHDVFVTWKQLQPFKNNRRCSAALLGRKAALGAGYDLGGPAPLRHIHQATDKYIFLALNETAVFNGVYDCLKCRSLTRLQAEFRILLSPAAVDPNPSF